MNSNRDNFLKLFWSNPALCWFLFGCVTFRNMEIGMCYNFFGTKKKLRIKELSSGYSEYCQHVRLTSKTLTN